MHVDYKQFEYASRTIWRRAVLAARLPACTPTPRPTRPDKERGNGRGILCTLEHGAKCTTFVRHHYRVYRSYTRPRRCVVFNTGPYTVLPNNYILNTANMQSETGFPSSHQLKSYVASKSRLKLAARAVLLADAGLLVLSLTVEVLQGKTCQNSQSLGVCRSL